MLGRLLSTRYGVHSRHLTLKLSRTFSVQKQQQRVKYNEDESKVPKLPNPLKIDDYFGVKNLVTVEELFKAKVHYGHNVGCRHHSMQPYIFGNRNDIDVINLDLTLGHLVHAMNFLCHMVYAGGLVLFVMRSHIHGHMVETMARDCGEYAQTRKWNRSVFLEKQENNLKLPDVFVFLSLMENSNEQHIGILDAAKINTPTIGIADTNTNPSVITYPVPGNDDSTTSVELYCKLFKTCVLRAKAKRKKDDKRRKKLEEKMKSLELENVTEKA